MSRQYDYYARAPESDAYVLIRASSWQEAERIAAKNGLRCGAHEMEAPSWNAEEPAAPKPRHLRSVP